MAVRNVVDAGGLSDPAQHQLGQIPNSGAAALSRELREMIDRHGADVVQLTFDRARGPLQGLGAMTGPAQPSEFPVRVVERDPYDDVIAMKASAPKELGEKTLTAEDLLWLRRKAEQQQRFAFRRYMANLYSGASIPERRELLKVYPELIQEQQSVLAQRIELCKRVANLRLLGPQTEDDHRLMFLISSQAILLPQGDLWDPSTWADTDPGVDADTKLARGLFNVRKYYKTTSGGVNPLDLMGDAIANRFGAVEAPFTSPAVLNRAGVAGVWGGVGV